MIMLKILTVFPPNANIKTEVSHLDISNKIIKIYTQYKVLIVIFLVLFQHEKNPLNTKLKVEVKITVKALLSPGEAYLFFAVLEGGLIERGAY